MIFSVGKEIGLWVFLFIVIGGVIWDKYFVRRDCIFSK